MLVASLGLVLDESLARISAMKNAVSAVVGLRDRRRVRDLRQDRLGRRPRPRAGHVVGGYAGARIARRLPSHVLRAIIVRLRCVVGRGVPAAIKAFA